MKVGIGQEKKTWLIFLTHGVAEVSLNEYEHEGLACRLSVCHLRSDTRMWAPVVGTQRCGGI